MPNNSDFRVMREAISRQSTTEGPTFRTSGGK